MSSEILAFEPPRGRTVGDVLSTSREPFLINGLVSSSITTVFGRPKNGKSALLVNLIQAAMSGDDFIGVPFNREVSRVHVIASDSEGDAEYGQRLLEAGYPIGDDRVLLYQLDHLSVRSLNTWSSHGGMQADPADLIILDPATALQDDGNKANEVAAFFASLEQLRKGAPIILVAHSSTSGFQGSNRHKVLGSTMWEARARWSVEVVEAKGGQSVILHTRGNNARAEKFHLTRGDKPFIFTDVVHTTSDELFTEKQEGSRIRELQTVQQVEEWAVFVEQLPAGITKREQAEKLHEQWPGTTISTFSTYLKPKQKLGRALARRAEAAA